jgi:hypothetical protein
MRAKGNCTPSTHLAAPCEACKVYADSCHIYQAPESAAQFFCEKCCPEHGAPLLAAGS